MASGRTSSSVGVGVAVTILGVATLALFVLTVIFYSQKRGAEKSLADREQSDQQFITQAERNSDSVSQVRASAKGQSVIGYLIKSQQDVMESVTGSRRDTPESLKAKLARIDGADTMNLIGVVGDLNSRLASAEQRAKDAEGARDAALADKEAEVQRIKAIQDNLTQTIAALNAEVDKYKNDSDSYRGDVNGARERMEQEINKIRDQAANQIAQLTSEKDKLDQENAKNLDRIKRLQDELRGKQYEGPAEFALVDGDVIGLDAIDNSIVLSVGRKQKVVLGMTFEIYSEPTAIKQDPETGAYAPGKAAVEVIRVDDNSAIARVVRERRGNPVVKGDVIANAVYDPRKTYKFTIYGNFDADNDGQATPQEQEVIRARIESWGGTVLPDLTGDVDFLVLGEKPVEPPQPPSTAPGPVVEQYVRIRRQAVRYDELFKAAIAANIPILNQNRLYTLTGAR